MNNRKLKKMLKAEKAYFVRDTKNRVLSCIQEPITKRRFSFSYKLALMGVLIVLGVIGILQSRPDEPVNYYNSYLLIDINPSIEFEVDNDGLLVAYMPLNEDAVVLLSGIQLTLNSPYDIEVNKIIEEAKVYGYLVDKQVTINVINDNQTIETNLRQELIERFLNNPKVTVNEKPSNIEQISTGKLVLIERLLERQPNLSFDQLSKESVSNLTKMLSALDQDKMTLVKEMIDQFKDEQKIEKERLIESIETIEKDVKTYLKALEKSIDEDFDEALENYEKLRNLFPSLEIVESKEMLEIIIETLEDDLEDYLEERIDELENGFDMDIKSSIDSWKNLNYEGELTIKSNYNESFVDQVKAGFRPAQTTSKNDRAFYILLNRLENHLRVYEKTGSFIHRSLVQSIHSEIQSYIDSELVSEDILESDYYESVMDFYEDLMED
jgi:gas vesicle protein